MTQNKKSQKDNIQDSMPSVEEVQKELATAKSADDFLGKDGIFSRLFSDTLEQVLEAELTEKLGDDLLWRVSSSCHDFCLLYVLILSLKLDQILGGMSLIVIHGGNIMSRASLIMILSSGIWTKLGHLVHQLQVGS